MARALMVVLVVVSLFVPACVVGRDCVDWCEDHCPASGPESASCMQACYQARCKDQHEDRTVSPDQ